MVKLRLMRGGRKKRPFYRIVAAHALSGRDGRFLENVGTYNPVGKDGAEIIIKSDRVLHWLQLGAQPTRTAKNIFSAEGIMLKFDLLKRGTDEAKADELVAKHKEDVAKRLAARAEKAAAKKVKKVEASAPAEESTDAAE